MTALGSINPLNVDEWEGFDYPEMTQVTPLLGDGTSATGNAVLQSSALGYPMAKIKGTLTASADLAYLRTYAQGKAAINFVYGATTYSVVVLNLKVVRLLVYGDTAWSYSCTLHQVA